MSDDRLADAADWIADQLRGQCVHDIEHFVDHCIEDGRLTEAESEELRLLDLIDQQVFLCDRCGWWCETSECNNQDGDEHCDDCHTEDDTPRGWDE